MEKLKSTGIPAGQLPPLQKRDLPSPVPLRKMIGPGIILAGLSLGSGEFVIWPYITYKTEFIFFWACLLGVTTQYFLNMEITRWTLATGETAITGFCRLSKLWAPIFLLLNLLPWVLPGWASAASALIGWLIWGTHEGVSQGWLTTFSITGLILCGAILTAGPVIYETVEKVQFLLISFALVLVAVLAFRMVQPDAIAAQIKGLASPGLPAPDAGLSAMTLLGALAFAGAGGTLNLGQSNYVKDKGYGMGKYIGRITSPITGQEEAIAEVGYEFPQTPENLQRWRRWWRAANWEHFLSFYLTCLVSLVLLTLICYSVFYDETGEIREGMQGHKEGVTFILEEAKAIANLGPWGNTLKVLFLLMGAAILLTTEFGVLDSVSRIATDITKTNWLRGNANWSESRMYYLFLWGIIGFGIVILLMEYFLQNKAFKPLRLLIYSSAMNGGVMFLYSAILLYMNYRKLPTAIRITWPRAALMLWSIVFFGFFTIVAVASLMPGLSELLR